VQHARREAATWQLVVNRPDPERQRAMPASDASMRATCTRKASTTAVDWIADKTRK
jgi:hypothetical protein